MRFALKALVVCVLAGLIASSGNSQQITASIRGTVVDASGAVVSSAAVTATQAETGFTRTVTSDGQGNFTVIELKNFRFAESKTIQFRGELFNIFNYANFGLPVNDLNSSNFGQIQTSQPGRLVQFALKFLF